MDVDSVKLFSKLVKKTDAKVILQWLKDNPTDNWLVIDDLDLHNSEIASHQVKTDAEVGLTENDVEKALNLLLG